ncbi:MAG TPA: HAD family hydrolase, partial [Nitrososphaeraceae archaeon]|nr:HAD family hydrolase [Nitrososphaeraceae archaeon]
MINSIFLVGRTLMDEENFYSFIDSRLLYLLNQLGSRIDIRNYCTIKNDIIRNRKLKIGGIEELVVQISKALMPVGYEKIVLKYILPSIEFAQKHFLYPFNDAKTTLEILSKKFRLLLIDNQDNEISRTLKFYNLDKYFDCCILPDMGRDPNKQIFKLILNMLKIDSKEAILIGDRLDTHIQMANKLEIITILLSNSPFNIQVPRNQNELPTLTLNKLSELPDTIS